MSFSWACLKGGYGKMGDLFDRHKKVIPSWVNLYYADPIQLVSGEGCYVFDSSGGRYLDFFGGILTTMTGYSVPQVVDAIVDQASKMVHSSTLYLISPMIELAEKIASLSGISDAKVFFVTSGTEANDTALLLASSFRNSKNFLAVRGSYHGRSLTSMSVTGNRDYSSSSFYPFNVNYVLGGSRIRGLLAGLSDEEYCDRGVADVEDLLENGSGGDVAAFIAEPIQGVGGFTFPPDGYFGKIKEVLDRRSILYISDEVQTGWGRTGENFWGYQAHGLVPDLITFAKGLGNGLALAGVIGRPEIMESLDGSSISTFGGNPLSCRSGIANLEYLLSHDLQSNALIVGNFLRKSLQAQLADQRCVAEVRGKGLMVGLEFVDEVTFMPSPEITGRVHERAKQLGLLVGKGGSLGNVLRIAPPMSLSMSEAQEGVGILVEAVRSCNS